MEGPRRGGPNWAPGATRRTAVKDIPLGYYFNPAAFSFASVQAGQPIPSAHDPAAIAHEGGTDLGDLGRNTFRGPGYFNFDTALIKDTPLGHRGSGELGTLEFRAEFFNIFNRVNFGLPSNVVRGSGFGIISKTAGTSRQIQFSLKLIF